MKTTSPARFPTTMIFGALFALLALHPLASRARTTERFTTVPLPVTGGSVKVFTATMKFREDRTLSEAALGEALTLSTSGYELRLPASMKVRFAPSGNIVGLNATPRVDAVSGIIRIDGVDYRMKKPETRSDIPSFHDNGQLREAELDEPAPYETVSGITVSLLGRLRFSDAGELAEAEIRSMPWNFRERSALPVRRIRLDQTLRVSAIGVDLPCDSVSEFRLSGCDRGVAVRHTCSNHRDPDLIDIDKIGGIRGEITTEEARSVSFRGAPRLVHEARVEGCDLVYRYEEFEPRTRDGLKMIVSAPDPATLGSSAFLEERDRICVSLGYQRGADDVLQLQDTLDPTKYFDLATAAVVSIPANREVMEYRPVCITEARY